MTKSTIDWERFEAVDIRTGTILTAGPLAGARKPSFRMTIDFGPLGVKRSSAQITGRYTPEDLVGLQVAAVVNFPPKRIAGFLSEVLVLGAVPESGDVVLLTPERPVPNGCGIA